MPEFRYDLRSDTVTKPSRGMLEAMVSAEVGDDMTADDPTVNRLEAMVAEMLDKEAAVYACSGTQSNQMGVRAHCLPGDELLINQTGHIANYEAGGAAVLSGVSCCLIPRADGMLDLEELEGRIRKDDQHLCRTRLVCLENTTNSGGGRAWPLEQLHRVGQWAHENGLRVHLDGARLFNACIAGGYSAAEACRHVDTISICFSKGLGCPMGSILVGSREEIARARRARKQFGGALRQAGVVAATAIYALENNIDRLAEDHENAKLLAGALAEVDGIRIRPGDVETNLVFFEIDPELATAAQFAAALEELGVRVLAAGPQRVRACTHLDVSREDVVAVAGLMKECLAGDLAGVTAGGHQPYGQ